MKKVLYNNIKMCVQCKLSFQKPICIGKQQWSQRKYCSLDCVSKANRKNFTGRIVSKEWRDKLSKAKIGKPSSNKGRKHTLEHKEKNRLAHLGVRSNFYKDGRSCNDLKEYYRIKSLERYARKRGAKGSFTSCEWEELKCKHDFKCVYCGRSEQETKLTKDHIVPLTRGGTNWISNIQPLCQSCNSRKGNRLISQYYNSHGSVVAGNN